MLILKASHKAIGGSNHGGHGKAYEAGDGVACTPLSDNLSAWREAVAASRRNHDEISDEALGALTRAVDAAGRRAMATPSASALEVLAKLEILDVQIRESAETGVRRDDELIAGLDAIAADADRLGLRGAADPDAEITAAVAASAPRRGAA